MAGSRVDAKVVLLGKEYGGKTSLVERYLHNRFSGDLPYQNTIGAAYGAKRTEVFGRQVVLGIWDTAGSERYQAMSRIYYRSAWAAVICFDLTDSGAWDKAALWAHEIRQQEPTTRLYFVGTKHDKLEDDPQLRQVEVRRVENFAAGFSEEEPRVFETSAKSGLNITALFTTIAKDFARAQAAKEGTTLFDQSLTLDDAQKKDPSRCAC